jgi:hypothetical protein
MGLTAVIIGVVIARIARINGRFDIVPPSQPFPQLPTSRWKSRTDPYIRRGQNRLSSGAG